MSKKCGLSYEESKRLNKENFGYELFEGQMCEILIKNLKLEIKKYTDNPIRMELDINRKLLAKLRVRLKKYEDRLQEPWMH